MNRTALLTFITVFGLLASSGTAEAGRVILFTDYGTDTVYVGILKGVIYTKRPEVRVDTLTNAVPPFDIEAGARLLAEGSGVYPPGTVFCCVVDPGVGTARRPIVLETDAGQVFVAPDNGLLTLVARRDGVRQVREATNRKLWRVDAPSSTFQGRDIFGPVSAMLAAGTPVTDVGPEVTDMVLLDLPEPQFADGVARGRVARVDNYGNIVTDLPGARLVEVLGLKRGDRLAVRVGGAAFEAPFVSTYADVPEGEKLVLIQSVGQVELAINRGSLAEALGTGLHDAVEVRKAAP